MAVASGIALTARTLILIVSASAVSVRIPFLSVLRSRAIVLLFVRIAFIITRLAVALAFVSALTLTVVIAILSLTVLLAASLVTIFALIAAIVATLRAFGVGMSLLVTSLVSSVCIAWALSWFLFNGFFFFLRTKHCGEFRSNFLK